MKPCENEKYSKYFRGSIDGSNCTLYHGARLEHCDNYKPKEEQMFKVGDVVECVKAQECFDIGGKYEIKTVNESGDTWALAECGSEHIVGHENFKLAAHKRGPIELTREEALDYFGADQIGRWKDGVWFVHKGPKPTYNKAENGESWSCIGTAMYLSQAFFTIKGYDGKAEHSLLSRAPELVPADEGDVGKMVQVANGDGKPQEEKVKLIWIEPTAENPYKVLKKDGLTDGWKHAYKVQE